ncbi:hypothetical protein [Sphingomonas sanxanigenens]|uniref:Uncharacterized protein n=1 Tax=Sphingomonas sanxanigenens DSM 19645 = NX02 TaxID=1123269 RepID=W0AEY8_9SPHN|nr:hypothetical protein [Sphingomonas sanxanigenens]AHE54863.1 hypothetical protein NX02_15915 [Sphingomonas sanxanigenens DSM 19645 = NX02]
MATAFDKRPSMTLSETERAYLERRERECLAIAERANNRGTARVHMTFAKLYRQELERL